MKNILALTAIILFITACHSGKKFTSRKYTAGRYTSHSKHKERVDKKTEEQERPVVFHKTGKKEGQVTTPEMDNETLTANVDIVPTQSVTQTSRIKPALARMVQKHAHQFDNNKLVQVLNKRNADRIASGKKSAAAARPGTKSIVSMIVSGLGIMLDIASMVMLVVTYEYIFLLLAAVGAIFGIIGLVMGIMGIIEYKTEKKNGNKDKKILILGIIGTAMGGVALYLALCAVYIAFLLDF